MASRAWCASAAVPITAATCRARRASRDPATPDAAGACSPGQSCVAQIVLLRKRDHNVGFGRFNVHVRGQRASFAALNKGDGMSFAEAARNVLNNYATFSGRARRSEYWWWTLLYLIALVVASVLDRAIGQTSIISLLVVLALLLPTLAVCVRRLHDTGRSGWWYFISFIPLIGLVLIVFLVQDSTPDNKYGPNPKGMAYPDGAPVGG
jgi:uncharacterized membrane protein YhaH (DUF805 family)